MAQPKPFALVKLVCGVIFREAALYDLAKGRLVEPYGPTDLESPAFDFNFTDYYEREMGSSLKRRFMSFDRLTGPDQLAGIKIEANRLEEKISQEHGGTLRAVNIDPGYLTASALVMATAKDFSHRIPLAHGIYAHLEFLFTKKDVRFLDWTYPDMRRDGLRRFFLGVRGRYLEQLRSGPG
jgi:hypothetical protein